MYFWCAYWGGRQLNRICGVLLEPPLRNMAEGGWGAIRGRMHTQFRVLCFGGSPEGAAVMYLYHQSLRPPKGFTTLITMSSSLFHVELDPIGVRNKSWYLQIAQGHRVGCADAPLPWSPITYFLVFVPPISIASSWAMTKLRQQLGVKLRRNSFLKRTRPPPGWNAPWSPRRELCCLLPPQPKSSLASIARWGLPLFL